MTSNEEREIIKGIDLLIKATEEQSNTMASINTRMTTVEQVVGRLDTLLRGGEDTIGLITDVAVLKATLASDHPPVGVQGRPAKRESTGPSWKWIAENYTTVAIPVILWLLLTVLPDVIRNFKGTLP